MNIKKKNKESVELMRKHINAFREGKISLKILVDDLEALENVLEGVGEQWHQKFLSAWGILEDVYSFAVYENKHKFDDSDEIELQRGLVLLEVLLEEL